MHPSFKRIVPFIAAIISTTVVITTTQASSDYSVPLRADGRLCQSVGVIPGFRPFTEPAGLLYFADKSNAAGNKNVGGEVALPPTFQWSGYDMDGEPETVVTFLRADSTTSTRQIIKTFNNAWSDTYTVTEQVSRLQVELPLAKPSTWLCFLTPSSPTLTPTTFITVTQTITPTPTTPTLTPTEHATTTQQAPDATPVPVNITVGLAYIDKGPTNLTPVAEPIYARSDGNLMLIETGQIITLTTWIKNTGPSVATNIVLTETVNSLSKVEGLDALLVGGYASDAFTVTVVAGENTIEANVWTAGDSNPMDNQARMVIQGFTCVDGQVYVGAALIHYEGLCPGVIRFMFLPVVAK